MSGRCITCGTTLTDEEVRYYGTSCEDCEQKWLERIEAWRGGKRDEEIDEYFRRKEH